MALTQIGWVLSESPLPLALVGAGGVFFAVEGGEDLAPKKNNKCVIWVLMKQFLL